MSAPLVFTWQHMAPRVYVVGPVADVGWQRAGLPAAMTLLVPRDGLYRAEQMHSSTIDCTCSEHSVRSAESVVGHPEHALTHLVRTWRAPGAHHERTTHVPYAHHEYTTNAPRTYHKHTTNAPHPEPAPRQPLSCRASSACAARRLGRLPCLCVPRDPARWLDLISETSRRVGLRVRLGPVSGPTISRMHPTAQERQVATMALYGGGRPYIRRASSCCPVSSSTYMHACSSHMQAWWRPPQPRRHAY